MRWDVPTRIVFLIGAPLIWIAVAGIDPSAIGLKLGLAPLDWILIALWSVGVALVTLSYRRWLWPVRAAGDRSALLLNLPFFLVLNPVAEELFFRGAALFGLANLIGMPWAIVVTSLVFGLHHGLDRQFPRSFLVLGTLGGLLFGIAAAHFESVAPAIVPARGRRRRDLRGRRADLGALGRGRALAGAAAGPRSGAYAQRLTGLDQRRRGAGSLLD